MRGVWEHKALTASAVQTDGALPFESVEHPLVLLMTADCDLEQDYNVRATAWEDQSVRKGMIVHAIFCDGYEGSIDTPGSDVRRRMKQNQDERYHYFPAENVTNTGEAVDELYLDFKKIVPVPLGSLYAAMVAGAVRRTGLLASPHLFDVIHRFYGFHSRIGID